MSHAAMWLRQQRIIRRNCTCWDLVDEAEFKLLAARIIAGAYKE